MVAGRTVPSLAAAIETAVARRAGVHPEAGASHDRAAYFNINSRTSWLGQVSEAATALAGTRVPKQLSESVGVSKISTEPSAAVTSISLSVRNDLSFNPADHLHSRSKPFEAGDIHRTRDHTGGGVAYCPHINRTASYRYPDKGRHNRSRFITGHLKSGDGNNTRTDECQIDRSVMARDLR